MIIVSQDKTRIINFENLIEICITQKDIYYLRGEAINRIYEKLGKYETEERAKEVLQEIWRFYEIAKRYECSSNNGITLFLEKRFTYEMPER